MTHEKLRELELQVKVADRFVAFYKRNRVEAAELCDGTIDRSGNILGWVRELARGEA